MSNAHLFSVRFQTAFKNSWRRGTFLFSWKVIRTNASLKDIADGFLFPSETVSSPTVSELCTVEWSPATPLFQWFYLCRTKNRSKSATTTLWYSIYRFRHGNWNCFYWNLCYFWSSANVPQVHYNIDFNRKARNMKMDVKYHLKPSRSGRESRPGKARPHRGADAHTARQKPDSICSEITAVMRSMLEHH